MTSTNLLYIYVIIINVVTFFIYGLDKSRAKAGQWRIPEAQLIFLAVIGGSVGALAGMKVFHHKTRKPKFKTGVPAILIIHQRRRVARGLQARHAAVFHQQLRGRAARGGASPVCEQQGRKRQHHGCRHRKPLR